VFDRCGMIRGSGGFVGRIGKHGISPLKYVVFPFGSNCNDEVESFREPH